MNPNKLSKEQADLIITKSLQECSVTGNRLGATIQKHMSLKQLSNIVLDSSKDFFYIKDDELAKEMFLKYCCDNEEIKE